MTTLPCTVMLPPNVVAEIESHQSTVGGGQAQYYI
jgi:hypothetical protein